MTESTPKTPYQKYLITKRTEELLAAGDVTDIAKATQQATKETQEGPHTHPKMGETPSFF